MSKFLIFFVVLIAVGAAIFFLSQDKKNSAQPTSTASPPSQSSNIDMDAQSIPISKERSNMTWSSKKIVGSSNHTGTIDIQDGMILVSEGQVSGGEFTIDMNSIQNTEAGAGERLVGHLKSADFFDVENFPDSKMKITKIEKMNGSEGAYSVTGNLTIKGKTNQITFPAKIKQDGNNVIADATFSIDRTKWGVTYGSGSFFDNLGDNAIDDLIGFEIHLET